LPRPVLLVWPFQGASWHALWLLAGQTVLPVGDPQPPPFLLRSGTNVPVVTQLVRELVNWGQRPARLGGLCLALRGRSLLSRTGYPLQNTSMNGNVLLALVTGLLTATSALTASWLTSRGNVRTTRVKAEADAAESHASALRDTRQAAYSNFLDSINVFKWQVIAAMSLAAERDTSGAEAIMLTRNNIVGQMSRQQVVALLAGPRTLHVNIRGLSQAAIRLMSDLEVAPKGASASDLDDYLTPAMVHINEATDRFIGEAQAALGTT
jgi:hypothetical protein